jgi:soluble lytic murein transglycosylase-like protein
MTEAIQNKNLVERFSRYISHVKDEEKKNSAFTEELAQKAEAPRQPEERRSQTSRGGRRAQPPPVRLGQAKSITAVHAQRLARYAPVIEHCARKYGVPVELICGVILQESGGNPRAVSPCGAKGLMQLMPGTAKRFGCMNSFDPVQNIDAGTRYLRFLLERFNGKVELAVAGYNAGEHNVEKHGNKIPPFAETRAYVPNVLGFTQTMINIFTAGVNGSLPANARRV